MYITLNFYVSLKNLKLYNNYIIITVIISYEL